MNITTKTVNITSKTCYLLLHKETSIATCKCTCIMIVLLIKSFSKKISDRDDILKKIDVTVNKSIFSNIGGQYYKIFTILGIPLRLKNIWFISVLFSKNQRTSCHFSAWRRVQPFSNIKVAPRVTSAENASALRTIRVPSQLGVDQVR